MINSLSGFAVAASIGISAILVSLLGMCWVERRLVGSGRARRRILPKVHRPVRAPLADRAVLLLRPPSPSWQRGGPGAMRRPRRWRGVLTARGSRRSRNRVRPRS
ncbi:hypothetical protein GCM10023222_47710 [Saccharopolyspora cebuensis]